MQSFDRFVGPVLGPVGFWSALCCFRLALFAYVFSTGPVIGLADAGCSPADWLTQYTGFGGFGTRTQASKESSSWVGFQRMKGWEVVIKEP